MDYYKHKLKKYKGIVENNIPILLDRIEKLKEENAFLKNELELCKESKDAKKES